MKVWPTNENVRNFIRHPTGGAFNAEGWAEWPDDAYTAHRLTDGDITTTAPAAPVASPHVDAAPVVEPKSVDHKSAEI